ncbi:hypothetical protein MCOR29_000064 [Pyricularia oryzae]|nr:hypothetical protein MCOR29_000064 [Pyricularia oryzae]
MGPSSRGEPSTQHHPRPRQAASIMRRLPRARLSSSCRAESIPLDDNSGNAASSQWSDPRRESEPPMMEWVSGHESDEGDNDRRNATDRLGLIIAGSQSLQDDEALSELRRTECSGNGRHGRAHAAQRLLSPYMHMLFVVVFLAFLGPVSAVNIAFDNCLDSRYTSGNPPGLQFVGIYVDAILSVGNDSSQNLKVTMWGNVTGSRSRKALPPASDTGYWSDPAKTEGKIVNLPSQQGTTTYVTTTHSKIDVLTYEPWNNDADFCKNLGGGYSCPLGPNFNPNATRNQLPSVSMANNFTTSYAFTSWSATFLIKYTDSELVNIGCVSATITPDLGPQAAIVRYLPVALLAFVGFSTIFAAIWSPWGTTDVFRWTSNYGRDCDLIRLVTPGFGDCLQHIQFVVLTGALSLNYPGFYQPIVSQLAWSTLMFNESFVTKEPGYRSLQDGIYVAEGNYGLQRLGKLTGMSQVADIWAGMIIWVLAIIASAIFLVQAGFGIRWVYRKVKNIAEEDLRSKNIPFSVGNIVRIVFNYFLLPIVALSTFQLVVASDSPPWTVGLAVVTLFIIVIFAGWLLYLIITVKPRAFLFDDLPTVLLYGPLYNTYSDEAATFALVPLFLTFCRGITIGAVQPKGIAQIVILAICEVLSIFTIIAVKPFQKPTSMNAYHSVFAAFRLASLLLMMAFIPEIGLTEGQRGWVGYAILVIHCCVMGFGFFLNALQTTLEVAVRLSGAGGDTSRGLQRGGLSKIFGMRQLQRRAGVSRNSHHSASGILDKDDFSKGGFVMPGGRVRSESAGSGVLLTRPQRSSSALDYNSIDGGFGPVRTFDGASSFTPTTPGEASTFSFLPSPAQGRHPLAPPVGFEAAADPYYRPPRKRGHSHSNSQEMMTIEKNRTSWASGDWQQKRLSQATSGPLGDPSDLDAQISRGPTPAPAAYSQPAISFAPRTDYSTREVDFYYGVRGQRLNSDAPSRKLVTGPADPTGPMASAAGWWRNIIGGKTKEKGKGFEVVRSARMPPAMKARGGDITDDAAPQGIPVAMSTLRNGPIESDDEEELARKKRRPSGSTLLDDEGNPGAEEGETSSVNLPAKIPDEPPVLPGIDRTSSIMLPSRIQSRISRKSRVTSKPPMLDLSLLDGKIDVNSPPIPCKSSKRDSGSDQWNAAGAPPLPALPVQGLDKNFTTAHASGSSSRLPFERSNSQGKQSSSASSMGPPTEELSNIDLPRSSSTNSHEDRPTSYGVVSKGNVSRIDPGPQFAGSEAELVNETTR